jgi:hypothetical protein
MFPYRSLPVERFEQWMDVRFAVPPPLAGEDARPPPASEIEKGCLVRAGQRLQQRIPYLCGLLGQRLPVLAAEDLDGFWRALRKFAKLDVILPFLAFSFKTSLLGSYLSLRSPWQRELLPV